MLGSATSPSAEAEGFHPAFVHVDTIIGLDHFAYFAIVHGPYYTGSYVAPVHACGVIELAASALHMPSTSACGPSHD